MLSTWWRRTTSKTSYGLVTSICAIMTRVPISLLSTSGITARAVLREHDALADLQEPQRRVQADEPHAADDQNHEGTLRVADSRTCTTAGRDDSESSPWTGEGRSAAGDDL